MSWHHCKRVEFEVFKFLLHSFRPLRQCCQMYGNYRIWTVIEVWYDVPLCSLRSWKILVPWKGIRMSSLLWISSVTPDQWLNGSTIKQKSRRNSLNSLALNKQMETLTNWC
uniref:Uncharacterized protein n=1 Tax=Cacopsylla melanoneura TaxID=428564 RepID=A0A8D9A0L9_9HEMI